MAGTDKIASTFARVARQDLVQPWIETPVLVRCSMSGLIRLRSFGLSPDHLRLETQLTRTKTAAGIMDNDPARPGHMLVSNFSDRPIQISKHQLFATATPLDTTIIHLIADESPATLAEEDPIGETPALPEVDNADLRQMIRIGNAFITEREKVCALLGGFEAMWNASRGQIDATEDRIELTPGAKPVH